MPAAMSRQDLVQNSHAVQEMPKDKLDDFLPKEYSHENLKL